MSTVLISGWRPGFKAVSAIQLVSDSGLGLIKAKAVSEQVLAGELVRIEIDSTVAAEALVERLGALGGFARVEPGGAAA